MIWKLSVAGIKSRLKDYLVLFSGLIVASMIFYMFLTIATNPAFLAKDVYARISYVNFIFIFGIILLAIITFVYLIYANSFLLNMRKHDYGMFMILGAKGKRIGLIIFLETLVTGILATMLGTVLGFGLTGLISKLLISRLGLAIYHFQIILPSAILGTFCFFIIMFFLGAIWNVHKLTKTPIINLLKENQKPTKINQKPFLRVVETVFGLILLAFGYQVMMWSSTKIYQIIPTALITIVSGSYFIFNALFSMIIASLIKKESFSYRGIRMFTLGQLKFRLHEYTRILTLISLLFALALGAITVGLNFDTVKEHAKTSTYYDTIVVSKAAAVNKEVAKLNIQNQQTYAYKETHKYIYFNRNEFVGQPLKVTKFYLKKDEPMYKVENLPTKKLDVPNTDANIALSGMVINGLQKVIRLVPANKWQTLQGTKKMITLLNVKDFDHDYPILMKIQQLQLKENPKYSNIYEASKPNNYQLLLNYSSGFEFMGFFLGIAFLTMLASTLMFKVLNGASDDKIRYRMLNQIGTRVSLLKRSINWEIGILFLLPAILGIIDVLFGLQLFRSLLPDPYHNIWLLFTIFIILYVFYYLLTIKLYKKIVLSRN
ncbi:FtsX-like permease family protein [Lactobacillus sp. ESL0228]|uniref:FtsX-like permease family protein n=1 Tax=Lactobacillus sp. ESL0228 TaxID=2069352 RepID=UPI000EFB567E|nr:FtsX-like permease family protein [Lactobacillus sp. ESL0228]RMC51813.1 ABC transporter permease [Lactobacillus sp. ESL0228]